MRLTPTKGLTYVFALSKYKLIFDLNSGDPFCLTRDISCRAADTPMDHDTMFFNRGNLSPFPTFRHRMTVVHPFQHENVLQPQDHVR